jgi:hypothetical protein
MSTPRGLAVQRDMALAGRTLQRSGVAANNSTAAAGGPMSTSFNRPGGSASASAPPMMSSSSVAFGTAAAGLLHADDVDVQQASTAVHPYPMNLSLSDRLLKAVEEQQQDRAGYGMTGRPAPSLELGSESLYRMQLDVNDYIDSLDARLRGLVQNPNAALAKRLRDTSSVPLSFMYFRLQQKMLRLSGDLSVERERAMLNKLASALSA